MNEYKKELEYYSGLNNISRKGGVVLFGSTFAKNIPVSELAQTFGIDCTVYNRSFNDLSVFDAQSLCDEAVLKIQPKKIIIQLGETDIERGYKSVAEITDAYKSLIEKFRSSDKKVKIVVVSVCSDENEASELNASLEALAHKCKCQFADISGSVNNENPSVKAFSTLKFFIPDKINFCDAMTFAGVC